METGTATPPAARSPLAITRSVWKALFLRETLVRISRVRWGWLWLVVEPVTHLAILIWLFSTGLRGGSKVIAGGELELFIMLGVLGFFMTRNVWNRCADAVDSSDNLFAFRQIKPVDTVLVRGISEGLLNSVLLVVMLGGGAMLGMKVIPNDALLALAALIGLWLFGFGVGLVLSVVATLVPELGRIVRMVQTPLYFFSAVMIPSAALPISIRDVLMFNPILHGLETLRIAFMPTYIVPPGINLFYLYQCAVPLILVGLALHVRYRLRLMTTT